MLDMYAKGRHVVMRGERNGFAKLTWDAVREMRRLSVVERYTSLNLAYIFKTEFSHVRDILNHRVWKEEP